MRRALSNVRDTFRFIRQGIRDIDTAASFLPSQRFLVDAMCRPLALARAKCIVELGPGTGALTKALLARMPADAQLHAIELDPAMHAVLTKRFDDPRLKIHLGNAIDLPEILASHGAPPVDGIASSLGLSLIPQEPRARILESAGRVMGPGAVFTQYSYLYTRYVVWSPGTRRVFQFRCEELLSQHFTTVESELVVLNAPTATVYACRWPKPPAR